MVLPGTWPAALSLLLISLLCFSLWPNVFKLAGRWRFELFAFDFALGALMCALLAAYTLGTLGAELNFSDSMLVAGRRSELIAVATGFVFALGNMFYLATIALLGLANGTLVTFSGFASILCVIELARGRYVIAGSSLLILALAVVLAIASAAAKLNANRPKPQKSGPQARAPKQFSTSTRGAITGVLAGVAFAGVFPVLHLAEPEQLGIGAYGGLLLATVGILIATIFFSFFFLTISLEGGIVSYSMYLTGTSKDHLTGGLGGFVCVAACLALYAACTGVSEMPRYYAWLAPFGGAFLAVLSGFIFWQKTPQPPAARRYALLSTVSFAGGMALLLLAMRK